MSRLAARFRTTLVVLFLLTTSIGALLYFSESASTVADNFLLKIRGLYTIEDRVAMYRGVVTERLGRKFLVVGLTFPPAEISLVAFKDSRRLEVYARDAPDQPWKYVHSYPIRGTSGVLGPKLASGDEQVPEGIYRAESLNPNSHYHLAIRVNYPNEFDRRMAEQDQRSNLGGDIMIHGSIFSVGCLAMGDDTAEDLFVLAALIKPRNVRIIISPTDFRHAPGELSLANPSWTKELYASLRSELQSYRR